MVFGQMLRQWRLVRRLTQEELADAAEVSTRHLSCLEGGKAKPSRDMVLVLASALDLPLRERNVLLNAAGFVGAYTAFGLDDTAMRPVRDALSALLAHHDPNPAFVFDTGWNLLMANAGAASIIQHFVPHVSEPRVATNLVHALFHPQGLRTCMVNWEASAGQSLARLRREVLLRPHDDAARAALDTALAYVGDLPVKEEMIELLPFLTVHLRRDSFEARFFTMLTSLGSPMDVTAQELNIETYYPVDAATTALLARLNQGLPA